VGPQKMDLCPEAPENGAFSFDPFPKVQFISNFIHGKIHPSIPHRKIVPSNPANRENGTNTFRKNLESLYHICPGLEQL
jgi:hypothetical protein